ncbi:MAG: alternative ribosome rescue aminoacyl-tRNA hydrolase ArfB [Phycisphaerales bacterium JB052]
MADLMSDDHEPKSSPERASAGQKTGTQLAPGVRVRDEEIHISFVRSSGPGGQNVNKRATKAQLRIALSSIPLDERAMARLRRLAGNAITNDDELLIEADETRSQARNKKASIERLRELVARAAVRPKTRRATKPTKGSIRRRLEDKSQHAEKKRRRRPPRDHD